MSIFLLLRGICVGGNWQGWLFCWCKRKSKAKATSFPRYTCTFHPDLSAHAFYQVLADIKAEPYSAYRSHQISFKPREFLKEHGYLFLCDTRACILYANTYLW